MFTRKEIEAAQGLVYQYMDPTAQIAWPQLSAELGCDVVVKHENHAPTGAFKVRGGITFLDWVRRTHPKARGIITATRGNHGQSQARAATAMGLEAHVYVPRGNAVEKNAAMRAYGARLVEHGDDFDEAREEAMRVAEVEGLIPVPPFHTELVRGVATYGFELFTAHPDLDTVYVPIGCGSGICGVIAARDALGIDCEVVGVVSTEAPGPKLSVEAGHLVEVPDATTFADGIAVRVPVQDAFDIYATGAARIVAVSDTQIAEAIRLYFRTIHNAAEGAGASALAALMAEKDRQTGHKTAVILSGGNIDTGWFQTILAGEIPQI